MYIVQFVKYVAQSFKQHLDVVVTFIICHAILKQDIYAICSSWYMLCKKSNNTIIFFVVRLWGLGFYDFVVRLGTSQRRTRCTLYSVQCNGIGCAHLCWHCYLLVVSWLWLTHSYSQLSQRTRWYLIANYHHVRLYRGQICETRRCKPLLNKIINIQAFNHVCQLCTIRFSVRVGDLDELSYQYVFRT